MLALQHPQNRRGHTLVELIAASVSSVVLLAGLAAVMFISGEVANVPAANKHQANTAEALNKIANELRFATVILSPSSESHAIEFVVVDRDDPADGTAERIRYEWSGTPGTPLERTLNGADPVTVLANVENCTFTVQSTGTPAVVTQVDVVLQSGVREGPAVPLSTHSRIDASIPLVQRPERLSAYWRADMNDPYVDPTSIDLDGDGADWLLTSGEYRTNPLNDFTSVTVVEAGCRDTSTAAGGPIVRINADRQGATWGSIGVKVELQADGSQTLTLMQGAADTSLQVVDNLAADPVKFRIVIYPATDRIALYVNNENMGAIYLPASPQPPYAYVPYSPTGTRRFASFNDEATAYFEYVEVRLAED